MKLTSFALAAVLGLSFPVLAHEGGDASCKESCDKGDMAACKEKGCDCKHSGKCEHGKCDHEHGAKGKEAPKDAKAKK